MVFGRPTNLPDVMAAIAAQAVTAGSWIQAPYGVLSLDMGRAPEDGFPSDALIVVTNPQAKADQGWVAGGGNDTLKFDGTIDVVLWDRLDTDEGYRDTQRLTNTTFSILKKWRELLKVLQLYKPVDSGSGQCILVEAMRVVGFRVLPPAKAAVGWASVVSTWDVKFIQDLS